MQRRLAVTSHLAAVDDISVSASCKVRDDVITQPIAVIMVTQFD